MTDDIKPKKYYMVRAMDSTEPYYNYFIDNRVVGIGWSNVNFSEYSDTEVLLKAIEERYYTDTDTLKRVVSRKLNGIRRFTNIKPGDCVVVPYHSMIAIADVVGDKQYDEKAKELDISNQIPVEYLYKDKELFLWPRRDLSNALQRKLRIQGNTVSDLSEFSEEIERIRQGKGIDADEDRAIQKFKKDLLRRIQTGEKTTIEAGGRGLEELVQKIFIWSGYEAEILPKNNKKGYAGQDADADIIATREDEFSEQHILVQVKHHTEKTSKWAVQQLIDALGGDKYQGYIGYVITTADDVEEDARKLAEENDIKIITGDFLMDILFDRLTGMDSETKKILGISSVPQFFG